MSQVRVDFIGDYSDLKKKTERAEKSLERMRKKVQRQSRIMNQAFRKIGAGLSLFALVNGLKQAGQAAATDAKSQRLLSLQMKTTTKATDKQIASNEEFIQGLSNQVGIVDDELRPAFAKLLRGTGKVKVAQKLLKIALDGSASSGKPLSNVSDALTKAFNGNYTTLYKLAPQLKKTKGGIEEYARSVQGAAVTSADPFSKLSVVVDNLNEQVGTALLPAFQGLANFFIDNGPAISQFLTDLFDPKSKLGVQIKSFGDKLGDIGIQVDEFFKSFDPKQKSGVIGFFEVLKGLLDGIAIALQAIKAVLDFINPGLADIAATDTISVSNKLQASRAAKTGISSFGPQKNYTINVNKANMTPEDIVKAILRYERNTGKKIIK